MTRRYLIAAFLAASVAAPALAPSESQAAVRLSLAGLMNYNVYSSSFGSGDLGFGGGFLGTLGSEGGLGVEFGTLYFMREVNLDAGATIDPGFPLAEQEQLHLPLLLRFGVQDLVSFGAGVFYEEPIGQGRRNNYGVEGSLRFSIPAGTATQVFLDGRFAHGIPLQGNATTGDFRTNDLFVLLGMTFGTR